MWCKSFGKQVAALTKRHEKVEHDAAAENEAMAKAAESAKKKRLVTLTSKYGSKTAASIIERKIWIGMTKDMLRESWGAPEDINRTVAAASIHEQWVYRYGRYVYIEDGTVTSWQD